MSSFVFRYLRLLALAGVGLAVTSCVTIPPPDVSIYNLEHKVTRPYIQPVTFDFHPCW